MERLSTGVSSLDRLIEGGIPRGFFIAAVGEPGTGKTILSIHFIAQGVTSDDLNIYVTTEESGDSIIKQAEQFGFDFESAIKNKKLVMIDALMGSGEWSLKHLDIDELVDIIIQAKKYLGYGRTRLVIDSLSAFWLAKPSMARQYSYSLKKILSKWDLTTLVTSQYAITTSVDGEEPVIIKNGDVIWKIPIHKLYQKIRMGEVDLNILKTLSVNEDLKIGWFPLLNIGKHMSKEPLYRISLEDGSKITVTGDHSIYIIKGAKIIPVSARDIKKDDFLVALKDLHLQGIRENEGIASTKQDGFPKDVISPILNLIDYSKEEICCDLSERIPRSILYSFLNSSRIKDLTKRLEDLSSRSIFPSEKIGEMNEGFLTLLMKKGLIHFSSNRLSFTRRGVDTLDALHDLDKLVKSNLVFLRVMHIETLRESSYVYDLTVDETQNFFAGSGMVLCHNSEAFGFGVEHIADGILRFRKNIKGKMLRRYILVEKMRQTNHSLYLYEVHVMPGKGLIVTSPTALRREDFALPDNVKKKISKHGSSKEVK